MCVYETQTSPSLSQSTAWLHIKLLIGLKYSLGITEKMVKYEVWSKPYVCRAAEGILGDSYTDPQVYKPSEESV